MTQTRKATKIEVVRGIIHRFAYPLVAVIAFGVAYLIFENGFMQIIIENAATLAVTGAAIAAFLFTIQSILISVPKENPFMQYVRRHGKYLIALHRFCRAAEIIFMLIMIPMLFMDKERELLNLLVLSAYIWSLVFTIWSMYLMGRILIACERSTNR